MLTIIYTDGACKGNPGPGGWGLYAKLPDGSVEEKWGGEKETTNNRMELTAVIRAMESFGDTPRRIITDSQYVYKGVHEWLSGWKKKQWLTSQKKPVMNRDLWERLDGLLSQLPLTQWEWVRGHRGDPGNEKADELANRGVPVV